MNMLQRQIGLISSALDLPLSCQYYASCLLGGGRSPLGDAAESCRIVFTLRAGFLTVIYMTSTSSFFF